MDVWPVSAFHPDALLPRMARFVADFVTTVGRPDLIVAHSSKAGALLKDGAFRSDSASSALLAPFRAETVSSEEDRKWEQMPTKRFLRVAGDIFLVHIGPFARVPAMMTPHFGVTKYDPRLRVPYLRLARLLALKQRVLTAAAAFCKSESPDEVSRKVKHLCEETCESIGLQEAIKTCRAELSAESSLLACVRGLLRYRRESAPSARQTAERQERGQALARWNAAAAVVTVAADVRAAQAEGNISPLREKCASHLFDDNDDEEDDDEALDAAVLDELRAVPLVPKVRPHEIDVGCERMG